MAAILIIGIVDDAGNFLAIADDFEAEQHGSPSRSGDTEAHLMRPVGWLWSDHDQAPGWLFTRASALIRVRRFWL